VNDNPEAAAFSRREAMLALPLVTAVVSAIAMWPLASYGALFAAGVGAVSAVVVGLPVLHWVVTGGRTRFWQLTVVGGLAGALPLLVLLIGTGFAARANNLSQMLAGGPMRLVSGLATLEMVPVLIGAASGALVWLFVSLPGPRPTVRAVATVLILAGAALPASLISRRQRSSAPSRGPAPTAGHMETAKYEWAIARPAGAEATTTLTRPDRPGCALVIHSDPTAQRIEGGPNPVQATIFLYANPLNGRLFRIVQVGFVVDEHFLSRVETTGCAPW